MTAAKPVLYAICCAAPPARDITVLVRDAQQRGWDVCVIATPGALKWLNTMAIEELTGHPVRSEYKNPGEPDVLPPPDAIVVAPATGNTLAKWAAGISDTLALGLLVEAIGEKLPVVALPFSNRAHFAHPGIRRAIDDLCSWGVNVLIGDDVYPLHEPGTGSRYLDRYPWHLVLDAVPDATEVR